MVARSDGPQQAAVVPKRLTKRLLLLRHGQAMHNPRAEAARRAGCSHDEFIELMRQDDVHDAPLTKLGEDHAREVVRQASSAAREALRGVGLIVSSTLSRSIQTADLVVPPSRMISMDGSDLKHGENCPSRICLELFREINGMLLNAKRRTKSDLVRMYGGGVERWDFSAVLSEEDDLWTETLERKEACAERGYRGLLWVTNRQEETVLIVAHGGLLRFMLNEHPCVKLVDGRRWACPSEATASARGIEERFGNCELRMFEMSWEGPRPDWSQEDDEYRPIITMTEVHDFD